MVAVRDLPSPNEILQKAISNRIILNISKTELVETVINSPIVKGKVLIPRNHDGSLIYQSKSDCAIVWARSLWLVGLPWEEEYKQLMELKDADSVAAMVKDKSWECMKGLLHGFKPYPLDETGLATLYRAARALPKPPNLEDPRVGMGLSFKPPTGRLLTSHEVVRAMDMMKFRRVLRAGEQMVSSGSASFEFERAKGGLNHAIIRLSKVHQGVMQPSKAGVVQGILENREVYHSALESAKEIFHGLKKRPPMCFATDIPERGWKHRVPTIVESVASILANELGRWTRTLIDQVFRGTFREQNFELGDAPIYTSGDFKEASNGIPFHLGIAIMKYGRRQTPLGEEWDEIISWLCGEWIVFAFHNSLRDKTAAIWDDCSPAKFKGKLFAGLNGEFKGEYATKYGLGWGKTLESVQRSDGVYRYTKASRRLTEPQKFAQLMYEFPNVSKREYKVTKRGIHMGLGFTQFVLYVVNYVPHIRKSLRVKADHEEPAMVKILGDDNVSCHYSFQAAMDFEKEKEKTGMILNPDKTIISERGYTIGQRIFMNRMIDGIKQRIEIPSLTMKQCIITERSLNDFVNKPGAVLRNTLGFPSQYRTKALSLLYHSMKSSYKRLEESGVDLFHPRYGLLPGLRARNPLKVKQATMIASLWTPRVTNSVSLQDLKELLPELVCKPHTFTPLMSPGIWRTRDIKYERLVGLYTAARGIVDKPSVQIKYTSKTYEQRLKQFKDEEPERVTTDILALIDGNHEPDNKIPDECILESPYHLVDYSNLGSTILDVLSTTTGTIVMALDGKGRETVVHDFLGCQRYIVTIYGNADNSLVGMIDWFGRIGNVHPSEITVYTNDKTGVKSLTRRAQAKGVEVKHVPPGTGKKSSRKPKFIGERIEPPTEDPVPVSVMTVGTSIPASIYRLQAKASVMQESETFYLREGEEVRLAHATMIRKVEKLTVIETIAAILKGEKPPPHPDMENWYRLTEHKVYSAAFNKIDMLDPAVIEYLLNCEVEPSENLSEFATFALGFLSMASVRSPSQGESLQEKWLKLANKALKNKLLTFNEIEGLAPRDPPIGNSKVTAWGDEPGGSFLSICSFLEESKPNEDKKVKNSALAVRPKPPSKSFASAMEHHDRKVGEQLAEKNKLTGIIKEESDQLNTWAANLIDNVSFKFPPRFSNAMRESGSFIGNDVTFTPLYPPYDKTFDLIAIPEEGQNIKLAGDVTTCIHSEGEYIKVMFKTRKRYFPLILTDADVLIKIGNEILLLSIKGRLISVAVLKTSDTLVKSLKFQPSRRFTLQ